MQRRRIGMLSMKELEPEGFKEDVWHEMKRESN